MSKNILLLILKTNKHSEFDEVYVKIKKIRQQIKTTILGQARVLKDYKKTVAADVLLSCLGRVLLIQLCI